MKRLLMVLCVLGGALGALFWLLMLASTSADAMGRHYPMILAANALMATILLALVVGQGVRLWRDIRAQVFGARLKLRLLLMFGLIAVIPGVLVYGVSMQFITRSIESWFDVRVEKALESGLNLGRSALDYLQSELGQRAQGMAHEISVRSASALRGQLSRLREQAAVDSVALFSPSGQLLVSSQRDLTQPLPPLPSLAELRKAQAAAGFSGMRGEAPLVVIDNHAGNGSDGAEDKLLLRVLVPIPVSSFFETPHVLQLTQSVPETLNRNAGAVQEVYGDYQELQLARQELTRIYALTLTLTVLVALFSAFVLAFFLARRLSAPLSILDEGTRAVAQGDYSQRQIVENGDELGALTQSFNRMTRQLSEARQETERHRGELEAARAYLESILANLSAGVLVFDAGFVLRTLNEGALTILGEALTEQIFRKAGEWTQFSSLGQLLEEHFARADEAEWQGQIEVERVPEGGAVRHLLLRGTRLPDVSGGGHVVVFDDVTQLISAQRSAAWGEVARRLAHEIKNPLTPIQLSAERLQLKLVDRLEEKDRNMLERATRTIINQVQAMKRMVDDFRDYSRHPAPSLAPLDLNALISEVLVLYEHSHAVIATRLAENLPPVMGDVNQLRQVIHNLLRNGEDALENVAQPELSIRTEAVEGGVFLEIRDNGAGFPADILPRVFEPYITTKPRGTGLGLPIVKKIIDEHRGEISIDNAPEGGACVSIRLPVGEHLALHQENNIRNKGRHNG
ncbi:MAG: HAMP domain-containing protein [Zoogloeaceae bacterium]|jgi:nitrogen fixation/metabolism regulation signal transduction histidine kinase|nr:HAMP domain-containing protein [Zoogloeaceae bacterium]